jgi:hypothetical protein
LTLEEARKVAAIVAYADGGCSHCVAALVKELDETFPEFSWTYTLDYELDLHERIKVELTV